MGVLTAALAFMLGRFATKLILALGIGLVTYTGGTAVLTAVQSYLTNLLTGMPAYFLDGWNVIGFNTAINMLFAAYSTKLAISGATRLVASRTVAD